MHRQVIFGEIVRGWQNVRQNTIPAVKNTKCTTKSSIEKLKTKKFCKFDCDGEDLDKTLNRTKRKSKNEQNEIAA